MWRHALDRSCGATDIVLNSTALGFVFELDDLLYNNLVSLHKRTKYEAKPPLPGSHSDVRGSPMIVSVYAWLVFALDVVVSTKRAIRT